MSYYIQRKDGSDLETVSENERLKDARHDLAEYQFSEPTVYYFISSRACKEWREAS